MSSSDWPADRHEFVADTGARGESLAPGGAGLGLVMAGSGPIGYAGGLLQLRFGRRDRQAPGPPPTIAAPPSTGIVRAPGSRRAGA